MYIAAVVGGHPSAQNEWIRVTSDGGMDPQWAADGNVIYFRSFRDGFSCIWGQRLDPVKKRPIGPPFAAYHAHSSRRSLAAAGFSQNLSVTPDRLAFVLAEQTGNIWMAKWEAQR